MDEKLVKEPRQEGSVREGEVGEETDHTLS